jgi:E3 ubiquitin-protein ligase HERC2
VQGVDVPIRKVVCGATQTAAIAVDGTLFTWGKCEHGSLGHGESEQEVMTPKQVEALAGIDVVDVVFGEQHAVAVDTEGDVFTWGWGGSFLFGPGALGHGDTISQPFPALVEALSDAGERIVGVAAGRTHSLALSGDGKVFSWGNGEYGRCGNGKRKQLTPELVDVLEGRQITKVAAGGSFSAAVQEGGDLWLWGKNDASQLGLGPNMAMDLNTMEEFPVVQEDLRGAVQDVACGRRHTIAVANGGGVYYWGSRTFIQPQRMEHLKAPAAAVAAGDETSAVLLGDGSLWTWGRGMRSGVLGHGANVMGTKVPEKVESVADVPIAW